MGLNSLNSFSGLDSPLTIIVLLFIAIVVLSFYAFNKLQKISILHKNILMLNQTVQELDHEAKLIIKSDMELKLYQEEVEDKLNKLTLLKNLILSSLHILDQSQLLLQINKKTVHDLGFKKGLILDFANLDVEVNIDFSQNEIEILKHFLIAKKAALKTTPVLSLDSEVCKDLSLSLQHKNFLIAPVKSRDNIRSIIVVSELIVPTELKRAEKEIFSIVCMYLGQCLDNIESFEELYRTKDELEKKVKERTNDLVKSLREIQTISKMKSNFISSVSHELRTPLTSVKGFSSLLVEEKFGILPPEAKKRLGKIDENVDKLVQMVNTLLDISRIESGKMEVKMAPCDIRKVINDVTDLLSPQILDKKINLKIDVPESLMVSADKGLMERVLVNLISNAIKFTPVEGIITVGAAEEDNSIIMSVADNGCGIEKANIERVFEEFFRVTNPINQNVKGTGLGLPLVKRIIDTHREKIWIESALDKGTCFYFSLKPEKNSKRGNEC
ncbi:MAG: HAMP domain-containing sensor histidine kinase [Candidatus Omnitrophica bacterium]|nr:HAMP domain-containing sensor histidine kinase [Candidatus Omnitrophota bacterium]